MARVHNIERDGTDRPVRRARLSIQVIASESGVAPAFVSTSKGTISSSATVETGVDGMWSTEMVPNEPGDFPYIVAPANSHYRIEILRTPLRSVRYTVSVPNPPAPTTTTAPVTLPVASVPVASTAGFLAGPGRSIWLNGQVVSYSSVTATSFEGCTGGSGTVPAGTAVEQSYWVGDILTEPVVGLPDLHQSVPVGAHAASAVAVSPAVAGATQVQGALAALEAEGDATAAALAAHAGASTAVHGIADTAALVVTTDPRLTDERVPVDGSVTSAKIVDGSIVDADIAAANKDGLAATPSLRTLGTGAQQAAAGNDARLSDQRVPVDGSVSTAKIADGAVTTAKIADGSVTAAKAAADMATQAELDAAVALRVAKAGDTMTGPLLLPDGSVTAPALAFSAGAGSTGVWRPAANVLAFAAGGVLAGWVERDGSTFFGRSAGAVDTSLNCTGFGRDALRSNNTGTNNSAFGLSALFSNTTGTNNSAFGPNALFSNTTGTNNSAFGPNALRSNNTGTNNSAFGLSALFSNTTGTNNSAFGPNALFSNTTGTNNSAFGLNALRSNTTGTNNSAFGLNALYAPAGVTANATTTGLRQTAVGVESGQGSATQLNDITVVGCRALANGDHATALGSGANAGAAGAVAVGRDSAGTPASTTTANEIRLGTALHTVAVPGLIRWLTAGNEQTTVGAAGSASALPPTPTKYLRVVDSAGTTLVIPAYAAA